jgi:hypothetical protein
MYQATGKPAEHPLARELFLMARRSEQDPVLKERYLALRKDVMAALGRRTPGLVARLVNEEVGKLVELVLVESRAWREAQPWEDHRQHLRCLRAAATVHLWLTTTGTHLIDF